MSRQIPVVNASEPMPRRKGKLKTADGRLSIDIEWTNRCNATCSFCPRDKTPKMGMMGFDVFRKILERCKELPELPVAKACGSGEPLIHPDAVEMVRYASSQGFDFNLTTNASLLTPEKSRALFDAGLSQLNLSISATGDLYNRIYSLDFERVLANVRAAVAQKPATCQIMVTIVEFEDNQDQIEKIRRFWKDQGINRINLNKVHNRGGSAEHLCTDAATDDFEEDARKILADNGMSYQCIVPYIYIFIGWDGQYYLCCHDWTKRYPLGSVFDYSIEDVADKKRVLTRSREGCRACSADVINQVRHELIRVNRHGDDPEFLQMKIDELKPVQQAMKARFD